jgi:tripartite-type tricarboxylate transporter receptor subunit TctC
MNCFRYLAALALLIAAASAATAQQFPTKPVTLVVPYAAGGNVDISARLLQAAIGNSLGQPIIVENRPGAGGLIAGEYIARSAPDGHRIFVGSNASILLGPMTMPNPPYHWETAFAPISGLAIATNLLVARKDFSAKTVAELVAYAKQNPDTVTLATSSGASINHFLAELLKLKAGITWTEVHYRGNAPALNDLVAGHVDIGFQQLSDSRQHIRRGALRALAVLGSRRVSAFPDVPSIVEAGYPEVQGVTFNGLFAPKNTPAAIVEKLSAAVQGALVKPEVVQKLAELGSEPRGSSPAEFAAFLQEEAAKWSEVIQNSNITVSE